MTEEPPSFLLAASTLRNKKKAGPEIHQLHLQPNEAKLTGSAFSKATLLANRVALTKLRCQDKCQEKTELLKNFSSRSELALSS